jgi:hypothetical protein
MGEAILSILLILSEYPRLAAAMLRCVIRTFHVFRGCLPLRRDVFLVADSEPRVRIRQHRRRLKSSQDLLHKTAAMASGGTGMRSGYGMRYLLAMSSPP